MNKKALALGITLALSLPGMASAAVDFDGGKLSSKDGPAYQPQIQSLDEVESYAHQHEGRRRLQDQPDAQTEAITRASRETSKEQKKRQEKGEILPSESTLPITIYGDQVQYNSETGALELPWAWAV